MICSYYPEPSWLVFTTDLPPLLYYSHIPTIAIALLAGLFVYLNGPKLLVNKLLFAVTFCFSLWAFFNLIAWTNIQSDFILFIWSFFQLLTALISILSIYLTFVFLRQKDASPTFKSVLLLLLLPVILIAPTNLNLSGINISVCGAYDFEGDLYLLYTSFLGFLAIIWIFFLLIQEYWKNKGSRRREILTFGLGIELFLIVFIFITSLGTYLMNLGLTEDSRLEMYGLFGMDIFVFVLTYLIVRFKAFNISLAATNALVIGLIILVGTQFTFTETRTGEILTAVTFILTGIAGVVLIRSVRAEVRQRKQIEALAKSLEAANARLRELDKQKSEFVSIASHQLRSPLTAMRGYASMLAEGSYGTLSAKAHEVAVRIEESAKLMAVSVEDYLNVSRIESGNMKYNLSDFNIKEMTEHICDDIRPEAMKKGLILLFRSNISGKGIVNADVGKTNQIIHNLINNSLKYTERGSINVFVHDDVSKKRVYVDITDTGIGMSQETMNKLFHKFTRADNANAVNVSGTGLGLFVALKMAEAMGGTISCKSEGDGKGSTFTFELPLAM